MKGQLKGNAFLMTTAIIWGTAFVAQKAGMDLLRIYKEYGEKIALMGGLDVRPVASNDIDGIRRELDSKIPFVKQNYGFILHTDHSVPESTNYDSYRFFVDYGLKLGTY